MFNRTQRTIDDLKAQLEEAQALITSLHAEKNAAAAELATARARLANGLASSQAAYEQAEASLATQARLTRENAVLVERLTASQATIGSLEESLRLSNRIFDDLRAEIGDLRQPTVTSIEKSDSVMDQGIEARLAELRTAINALGRQTASDTKAIHDSVKTLVAGARPQGQPDLVAAGQTLRRAMQPPLSPPGTPSKSYFLISSFGRTATQWLVDVINSHPQMIAAHGHDFNADKLSDTGTGAAFVEKLKRSNLHDVSDIDSCFDKIDRSDYLAIGNVHGINFQRILRAPPRRRSYVCCYLTRHPIARILSVYDRWSYESSLIAARQEVFDSFAMSQAPELAKMEPTLAWIEKSYRDKPATNRLLIASIIYVIMNDLPFIGIEQPTFLSERMTSEADYLAIMLKYISGGRIEFSEDFVTAQIERQAVDERGNRLRKQARYQDAYRALPVEHRQLLGLLLQQRNIADYYLGLGYDVTYAVS